MEVDPEVEDVHKDVENRDFAIVGDFTEDYSFETDLGNRDTRSKKEKEKEKEEKKEMEVGGNLNNTSLDIPTVMLPPNPL